MINGITTHEWDRPQWPRDAGSESDVGSDRADEDETHEEDEGDWGEPTEEE